MAWREAARNLGVDFARVAVVVGADLARRFESHPSCLYFKDCPAGTRVCCVSRHCNSKLMFLVLPTKTCGCLEGLSFR